MYYVDITPEELAHLRESLDLLERLRRASGGDAIQLYLYGLSSDPGVLDAAKECIASESDEQLTEADIALTEVVVELPVYADQLYYLLGSGVELGRDESFAYMGAQGEGAREIGFNWAQHKPKVVVKSFSKMALSEDPGWGDKFLMQYGNKVPMKTNIQRSEPSTGVAEAPAAPTAPPAPGLPKQTSLNLDAWLGGRRGN
jgi:hypothetical protein